MSVISQLTYGFCSLGGVIPLLWSRPWETKATMPPPIVSSPSAPTVIEQILEEGYKSCSELQGFRRDNSHWYVCAKKGGTNEPSFFQYKRIGGGKSELKRVQKITSSGVLFTEREVDHQTRTPFWISKIAGNKEVTPEKDCSYSQIGDGSSAYKLTCGGHQVQTTGIYM